MIEGNCWSWNPPKCKKGIVACLWYNTQTAIFKILKLPKSTCICLVGGVFSKIGSFFCFFRYFLFWWEEALRLFSGLRIVLLSSCCNMSVWLFFFLESWRLSECYWPSFPIIISTFTSSQNLHSTNMNTTLVHSVPLPDVIAQLCSIHLLSTCANIFRAWKGSP